jgi:ribonuclease D
MTTGRLATEIPAAPVWVDSPEGLRSLCGALGESSQVAVDTESNSLHAYREQVCLIQFSTGQTDFVLDPLAMPDLGMLAPIMEDGTIEKVFHAAEYDLICLRRDFGMRVRGLFDTMHAARVLGLPSVGLESLLRDNFGVELDKRHQKADWGARPLRPDQVHYACLDTHFLLRLRQVLWEERQDLAQEDFSRMAEVEVPPRRTEEEAANRFAGRRDITGVERSILSELARWRERVAEKLNRPLYRVATDELLLAIARAAPGSATELAAAGLSSKQQQLWGVEILQAVQYGTSLPPAARTPSPRRDDEVVARLEKLKAWRKKVAGEWAVESDIILPRPYLLELAEHPPANAADLDAVMSASPGRVRRFGAQILELLGD